MYECTGCHRRNQLRPGQLCLNCRVEGPEKVRRRLEREARARGPRSETDTLTNAIVEAANPGTVRPAVPKPWQRLKELGYIVPAANLPSILQHGLLSYAEAQKFKPLSLADEEIQDRRDQIKVGTRYLHRYVNLYLNPRNAMLYRVRNRFPNVGVLMVDAEEIFKLSDIWVSDRNAAASHAKFYRAPSGLKHLDWEAVYSESWAHGGKVDTSRKQAMQAEILVPTIVPPGFITRLVVSKRRVRVHAQQLAPKLRTTLNPDLFFA